MPERTPTDLERRLHTIARRYAVRGSKAYPTEPRHIAAYWQCHHCGGTWVEHGGDAEYHNGDCILRPDALTKGDER